MTQRQFNQKSQRNPKYSNWIPNKRYLRERVENKLRDSFWILKKSLDGSGKKERRSGCQVLEALMSVGRNTTVGKDSETHILS